ncbi:putative alpha-l-rhamnosidase c [Ceratocystis lukuohia]|uniref:Alpha-L-rhamnosidase C n=2 Tax=Ceratocystis TaxID=5157 RepID=A0A2C5WY08_9PEZI|nr:hypothetical protein CFIMG_003228RA [Ceratocystis fimbriata CBS 114723]
MNSPHASTPGGNEPFPELPRTTTTTPIDSQPEELSRFPSSGLASTIRRMSKTFEESDIPPGFMAATGTIASSAVNPPSRRRSSVKSTDDNRSPRHGSFSRTISNDKGTSIRQMPSAVLSVGPSTAMLSDVQEHPSGIESTPPHLPPPISTENGVEEAAIGTQESFKQASASDSSEGKASNVDFLVRSDTATFDNGYHFPPSYTAWESTKHFSIVLWRYFLTPVGFLVVLYGLNVIAWGGMLFLLLCNAAPAMCHPSCNDINSPRRKWLEVDQQIINALFCVTGFGFAPWRFRDLWYLMQFRLLKKFMGLQRLAGINNSWFRLPGSQSLPPHIGPENVDEWPAGIDPLVVPYPSKSIPRAPLTGERALPTAMWKMDTLVWMNFMNTIFQVLLSAFMWGMNRFDRPGWVTGFLVSMGIGTAIIGGLLIFLEGKRVKGIEGVPLTDRDIAKLNHDKELGISHYNNLSAKKPKVSGEKNRLAKRTSSSSK